MHRNILIYQSFEQLNAKFNLASMATISLLFSYLLKMF